MSRPRGTFRNVLILIAACLALLVPAAGAGAATVVNGDFETGDLTGWQQFNQIGNGEWFVYDKDGVGSFFPPPSGYFAAVDNQSEPDLDILYQDVALEPGVAHQLGLTFYYVSTEPIFVDPDTLSAEVEENQQVRVDVMRPSAPIDSVDPGDILTTVFANKTGDPQIMAPTRLTADLTPFAGQTVRLRIANSVTEGPFNTGLDAVSIAPPPVPLPPPAPPNDITRGKLTLNKKKGTAKLTINVPGAGSLKSADARKAKKRVKGKALNPAAAGAVKVPLVPTKAGKKTLDAKGKLKVKVKVTFTPTGGTANTETFTVTLKKNLPKD
jgi:hypothetical protein